MALALSARRALRLAARSRVGAESEARVRRALAQHAIDGGEREGLSTPEREELRELRRKLLRVEQERDLLKRAAAFFARETEIR